MEKYLKLTIAGKVLIIPISDIIRIVEKTIETKNGTEYQCLIHQSEFDEPILFSGNIDFILERINQLGYSTLECISIDPLT